MHKRPCNELSFHEPLKGLSFGELEFCSLQMTLQNGKTSVDLFDKCRGFLCAIYLHIVVHQLCDVPGKHLCLPLWK